MARRPEKDAGPDYPVDFVLLWVDGTDPEWKASMRRWKSISGIPVSELEDEEANGDCRYRDYGLLRYWFRGVERFAPWVRRVFFVTSGQRPAWLDTSCPKLRHVSHAEFMPAGILPTFHCRPIHFFLHRIHDLSERFVLFDDDMFLLRPVAPSLYFRGGLPVLPASLRMPRYRGDHLWVRSAFNNFCELNTHLDAGRAIRANAGKWFNPFRLGPRHALGNFARYLLNRNIPADDFGHVPQPHLKSTFDEIWRRCPAVLSRTTAARFRSHDQVTQWLACAWNLATGRFHPVPFPYRSPVFHIGRETLPGVCAAIRSARHAQICLQDKADDPGGASCMDGIRQAFEEILPGKSSFEKD